MQRRGKKINFKKKELNFQFWIIDFVALKNNFSFKLVFVFFFKSFLKEIIFIKGKKNKGCSTQEILKYVLFYNKKGENTFFKISKIINSQ